MVVICMAVVINFVDIKKAKELKNGKKTNG
jgi:hypothetical protein